MVIKCKCPNCNKVTYITGLYNNRKRVTKFKKIINNLKPCIYCDKDDCEGLNWELEKIGAYARFKTTK